MSSSASKPVLLVGPSAQRDLVAAALTGAGLTVEILDDPFDAVLRCDSEPPGAVVVHLDELDEEEIEAIRTLRDLAPEMRILASFTAPHRHKAALALTVGADAYLLEPYYLTELLALLGSPPPAPRRVAPPASEAPPPGRSTPNPAPNPIPGSPADPRPPAPSAAADVVPLEDFAGGVAHEINNPLTVISGWIEVLIAETEVDSPRRSKLESALEETRRIQRVVDSLQAFSREGPATFEGLDLSEVVERFAAGARGDSDHEHLTIRTLPSPSPTRIRGDREALRALLDQLVRNAARATEGRGTVTIQTTTSSDGEVVLTVSDDGRGIAPEHRERMFRPFFSGFAGENCTGLGLAACRGIVLQHSGTIALADRPGFGATFEMRFPPENPLPNPGLTH